MVRSLLVAVLPAVSALSLVSCYYDPYGYAPSGGSYYGGYSGSVFVSTGDPLWGYDPYRYCYYNYSRRCYYDPYQHGYYPVGYRPPPIHGRPHPHGWRPGNGHCPPPGHVNDRWIDRYQDRVAGVKASNTAWASKVRDNRQSQAQHMQANNAVWANRVTNGRQAAIQTQRNHSQAIRSGQQVWADRVRDTRQNQAAVLRSGNVQSRSIQTQAYQNARIQQAARNQSIAGGQAQWADRVRQQRADRQAVPQIQHGPRVVGGGGYGGGGGGMQSKNAATKAATTKDLQNWKKGG